MQKFLSHVVSIILLTVAKNWKWDLYNNYVNHSLEYYAVIKMRLPSSNAALVNEDTTPTVYKELCYPIKLPRSWTMCSQMCRLYLKQPHWVILLTGTLKL